MIAPRTTVVRAIAVAVSVAVSVAVLGAACRGRSDAPARGEGTPVARAGDAAEARPPDPEHPLSKESIYDLDLALTNQRAEAVSLAVHRGHPTIVSMLYASCSVACPRLIDEVKAFEAALPPAQRDDLRVLLVSFDPARDTPARLAELAAQHRVALDRWQLATAPDPELRELAAVLGIRYRVLDSGEYFHTSVVTLLDRDGRPIARVEGLGRSAKPLTDAMAAGASAPARRAD